MFLTSHSLRAHALPVKSHCDESFRENMFNCAFRQLRGRRSRVVGQGSKGVGVEGVEGEI